MRIDTTSYEFMRNGKKPGGVDYYCFEVHYNGGKRVTEFSFHGDYENCLNKVKERCENIIEIYVGV